MVATFPWFWIYPWPDLWFFCSLGRRRCCSSTRGVAATTRPWQLGRFTASNETGCSSPPFGGEATALSPLSGEIASHANRKAAAGSQSWFFQSWSFQSWCLQPWCFQSWCFSRGASSRGASSRGLPVVVLPAVVLPVVMLPAMVLPAAVRPVVVMLLQPQVISALRGMLMQPPCRSRESSDLRQPGPNWVHVSVPNTTSVECCCSRSLGLP